VPRKDQKGDRRIMVKSPSGTLKPLKKPLGERFKLQRTKVASKGENASRKKARKSKTIYLASLKNPGQGVGGESRPGRGCAKGDLIGKISPRRGKLAQLERDWGHFRVRGTAPLGPKRGRDPLERRRNRGSGNRRHKETKKKKKKPRWNKRGGLENEGDPGYVVVTPWEQTRKKMGNGPHGEKSARSSCQNGTTGMTR